VKLHKFLLITIYTIFFLFFPSIAFASDQDLIINEIMYDFSGSDTDHEWVEVYNTGIDPVTIIGGSTSGSWRLYDGANNRTLSVSANQGSMIIGAGEFAIVAQNPNVFLSDNPSFNGNLIESSAMSLGNTARELGLRIGSGGEMWGKFAFDNNQGAAGDGNSLQRQTDNTLLAGLPTPGSINTSIPPTPTSTLTPIPTPTEQPSSTPTKTPTPTKTLTPTKSPTSSPIPKSNNISPSSINSLVKVKETSEAADNSPTSILGKSTSSASLNSPTSEPTPTIEPKFLGINKQNVSSVFIVIGVVLLSICAILVFRKYKPIGEDEL